MPITSYIKAILKGQNIDRSIVSLKPMGRTDYFHFLSNSKVMVDVSNPNQSGLAMRIIEALATNTKVLTNNISLKNDHNIYDDNCIAFFNDKQPQIDSTLLNCSDFGKAKVFSISKWVEIIFEGVQNR